MAILKHISSKNANYGDAEKYLTFEHDEFTMKPTLDADGRLIPRVDYRISSLNCGGEDFAVACMRSNLRYGKNQKREDVKSHHYIISFDPRDGPDKTYGEPPVMLSDDRPTDPAWLPIFSKKEHFMGNAFGMIPGLETDEWSNDACRGYVIMAMEDCGFSKKDIRHVVGQLYEVFDLNSVEDAKEKYHSSPY